ncbi:MAG: hypothetical protein Q8O67_02080 [Deltaproteobacteria bacterium]|nr:hypothetical protein [Deltaproteobacteria bacterium]
MSVQVVADDVVAAAVDAAVSSLLVDKDVTEIAAVEGGLIEVVRRGRRERLQVLVEGELFALLRERCGGGPHLARLSGGVRLVAAVLVDGRIALSLSKPAPTDARLEHLVEEGVLPAGVDGELLAAVLEGGGVAVIGPARAARARVVVAVARALSPLLRIVSLSEDVPVGCVPGPAGVDVEARAATAVLLGADVLVALDLTPAEACALARAVLPVPVVAAVRCASMAALQSAFGELSVRGLFALSAVLGLAPDGRPRLVEIHGAAGEAMPPSAIAVAPTTTTTTVEPSGAVTRRSDPPSTTTTIDVPALPDAPPADWASSSADDDPGWELGSMTGEPAPAGSFDAALQAASKRPAYTPRPPPAHPQTPFLKGTGGLTLDPPEAAGAGRDDDER